MKVDITWARIAKATGITTVVKTKAAIIIETRWVSSVSMCLFSSVELGFLFAFLPPFAARARQHILFSSLIRIAFIRPISFLL